MEILYSFGIVCIQYLQLRVKQFEWYLDLTNRAFNPHHLLEYGLPLVSAVDSVFGAQLLMSVAFGGWCNTMLKWILVEDRPFWWIHETSYYNGSHRPGIRQHPQTCESAPGSPSGHCSAAATMFMLAHMWCSHVVNDLRNPHLKEMYSKIPLKMIYFGLIGLVGTARMYVAAHFPHQCLLGGLVGSFISPSICLFVTDPYLFRAAWAPNEMRRRQLKHVLGACAAIALSGLLALIYYVMAVDLHWSTRMAFRWCESPATVPVKSSPVFSLVQSTGALLGWALAVTPDIVRYRHNTRTRNGLVTILGTALAMYGFKRVQEYIPKRRIPYFGLHFVLNLLRPYVYLRLLPALSIATYIPFFSRRPLQARR